MNKDETCKACHYHQKGGDLINEDVSFCSKLNIKYVKEWRAETCEYFKPSLWEDREELLEMGKNAIMEKYNISKSYVSTILSALRKERFDVLVESLSIAEKAEALDVCEGSVRAYHSALKKVNMR